MAKYFAAFRIDNCHWAPLHVAEHFLDEARKIRPDLAVFAELFTGNEQTDYAFVKRSGLSALIREAMRAWSTQELSQIAHKHGGRPIGSFDINLLGDEDKKPIDVGLPNGNHSSTTEVVNRIRESPVQALFMGCTHEQRDAGSKARGSVHSTQCSFG
jgi:glycogen debranching enzyme